MAENAQLKSVENFLKIEAAETQGEGGGGSTCCDAEGRWMGELAAEKGPDQLPCRRERTLGQLRCKGGGGGERKTLGE
jgi:hypothetical protein